MLKNKFYIAAIFIFFATSCGASSNDIEIPDNNNKPTTEPTEATTDTLTVSIQNAAKVETGNGLTLDNWTIK